MKKIMIKQLFCSYYNNGIKQVRNGVDRDIFAIFESIKNGDYEDTVNNYRKTLREVGEIEAKKLKFPYFTASGVFNVREEKGLKEANGIICIDVDDLDSASIDKAREQLSKDAHVLAYFISRSGGGLAIFFKINPSKFKDSFDGLAEYLFTSYGLIVDQSCKDVSRARYVSYDPFLYVNVNAIKSAFMPKPVPKAIHKLPTVVFVQSDFDNVVRNISDRRIDITGDYNQWLRIGFAIASKFGEFGRSHFHEISRFSTKYDPLVCDKQYNILLKRDNSGINIATFYYYAKEAGIEIASEEVKEITRAAVLAKKDRRGKNDTIELVIENIAVDRELAVDVVNQVYENNIEIANDEDNIIDKIEAFLKHNYQIAYNIISRRIEINGTQVSTRLLNSIFIRLKKIEPELNYEIFERVLNSEFTHEYNPLLLFFEKYKHRKPNGEIAKLAMCIETHQDLGEIYLFIRKWLIAIISSIVGNDPKPLMLVLAGGIQNTGKTEFFRRLLPKELMQYYTESKLNNGKDDEILMCEKIIIMDDELSGKSKKENDQQKEILSKRKFTLRAPYGRENEDYLRIATLCGTTNDLGILKDPTGNRRFLPVEVISIHHREYNEIDKIDILMEAYNAYIGGETADIDKDLQEILNRHSLHFEASVPEKELLIKHFETAEKGEGEFMTTTDIKVHIEKYSQQRLNQNKLGSYLKSLGFNERYSVTNKGLKRKGWDVKIISNNFGTESIFN